MHLYTLEEFSLFQKSTLTLDSLSLHLLGLTHLNKMGDRQLVYLKYQLMLKEHWKEMKKD